MSALPDTMSSHGSLSRFVHRLFRTAHLDAATWFSEMMKAFSPSITIDVPPGKLATGDFVWGLLRATAPVREFTPGPCRI